MPELRNYHIFISHSWDYSEHYEKIKNWLNESKYFSWSDYSVPLSDPLEEKDKIKLQYDLRKKISLCSCIIILSGMYVSYSEWIDFEINTALSFKKPIIAVKPWGQERIPRIISEIADVVVGWNSSSIVDAVRAYAL